MRISDWSSDVCSSDLQFGWKRIGSVRDSTAGSVGRIPAYDYFDLNLAVRPPVEGLTLAFGIDNLFDKKPPLPVNPGAYNPFPDTYDVLRTTFGFSVTLRRCGRDWRLYGHLASMPATSEERRVGKEWG